MANLKRYDIDEYWVGDQCGYNMGEHKDGDWVKFDDIKDFLPSTSDNTESTQCCCPVDGSPLTPVYRCELHDLTFYKR